MTPIGTGNEHSGCYRTMAVARPRWRRGAAADLDSPGTCGRRGRSGTLDRQPVDRLADQPAAREASALTPSQELHLHRVARKTWGFFEKFVGPEDQWLPPTTIRNTPSEFSLIGPRPLISGSHSLHAGGL